MRTGQAVSFKGCQADGGLQMQPAAAGRMENCFGGGEKVTSLCGYLLVIQN